MLVDTALSGLRQTDPRCCIFLFCNPPIQKRHLPRCSKAGNLHKSKVSNHDYLYPVFSQLIQDMHAGLEYSSVKIRVLVHITFNSRSFKGVFNLPNFPQNNFILFLKLLIIYNSYSSPRLFNPERPIRCLHDHAAVALGKH